MRDRGQCLGVERAVLNPDRRMIAHGVKRQQIGVFPGFRQPLRDQSFDRFARRRCDDFRIAVGVGFRARLERSDDLRFRRGENRAVVRRLGVH
jgi:hypothetical protein